MPSMEEVKAFEHGCRCTLKMLEGCGHIFQEGGVYGLSDFIFMYVDKIEKDVKKMTDMYAASGYNATMQTCTYRRKQ